MQSLEMYEEGDLDFSSAQPTNVAHDDSGWIDVYIEKLNNVVDNLDASPAERNAAFLNARMSLSSRQSRYKAEKDAFEEITTYHRQIQAFIKNRRDIVSAFLLTVDYTPCEGKRYERYGFMRLRRQEICQAHSPTLRRQVRAIIASDRLFLKKIAHGIALSTANRRRYNGEYGI